MKIKRMKNRTRIIKSVAIILVILLTAFMLSCGGGGGSVSNSGTTKVTVSIGQSKLASFADKLWGKSSSAIPSNVVSIRIVISAVDMTPIEKAVDVSGSTEIVETFEVPNGSNRHFLAVAHALDGSSLYQGDVFSDLDGTAKDITIQMGFDISGDWTITHTLQNGQHTDFITYAQTGNSLTLSGDFIGTGNTTGNDIHLSFIAVKDCAAVTATGTVSSDGSTASGTFTATGTTEGGCQFVEGSFIGTWTAARGHIAPLDVTGAWSFFHAPQGQAEQGPDFFRFTQTGNSVAFTFINDNGSVETGNGSISGNDIQLSFANIDRCDNPVTVTLTGIISADGNTMTGTYALPGTSGSCVNGETGTWSAAKAQPPAFDISGSWSGFLTPQGGTEQGPNCITFTQAGSFLTFSGALGGSGILSGNNIQFHFAGFSGGNANPACKIVNHHTGTIASDGNSASGTYTTTNECGILPVAGTWRAVKGACTPPMPPTQGTISGTVTDALTGTPLDGVTVKLSQQGLTVTTGTTGSDGTYSLTVPSGSGYSIEFSKTGYITSTIDNIIITANVTATLNAVLSPVLSAGQARIVLTWDYSKGNLDLDSHLKGPRAPGDTTLGPFHTWFADKIYSFGGTTYADLDLDWISPSTEKPIPQETTTIDHQVPEIYTFYVHDFTNGGSTGSVALSNSSATVRVYIGNNPPATYFVPVSQVGTVWTVFQLNGGALTPLNIMSSDETVIQSASKKSSFKTRKK